jgi:hypothetical protein
MYTCKITAHVERALRKVAEHKPTSVVAEKGER